MTTFYCPNCWREVQEDTTICPACGTDIPSFWHSMSYEEKLIHALKHPEPTTVMRSVWLLGEMKVAPAVPTLISLAEQTKDLYILREIVRTLAKIDTEACRQALTRLTRHPATMIRREAENLLKHLSCE